MTLILYYHPFSSYCQKALLALYEKDIPFEPYHIDLGDPRQRAELAAIWPYAKFPVLHDIDAGVTVPEAGLICDYVDGLPSTAPRLVPEDPEGARRTRVLDRVLDNYLNTPLGRIVGDRLRPEGKGDPTGVAQDRALIATTYDVLEKGLADIGWLGGPDFSLADCAAAPPLFYTARLVPLDGHRRLAAYLKRVMERPSFKRCLDDARSFRPYFPSVAEDAGWPDEDDRVSF